MNLQNMFLVGQLLDPASSDKLRTLFQEDRKDDGTQSLLSSDPIRLDGFEAGELKDPSRTITMVGVDLLTGAYVGHASIHRMTTVAKGTIGHVELVVTHPAFRGRGIGVKLMIALVQEAQRHWLTVHAVKLTSRVGRETARGMYERLGFTLHGTERFSLELGDELWMPANGATMDAMPEFAFDGLGRVSNEQPADIAFAIQRVRFFAGSNGAQFGRVLVPIAVCQYKERSLR